MLTTLEKLLIASNRISLLESALRSIENTIGPTPISQTEKDILSIVDKAIVGGK